MNWTRYTCPSWIRPSSSSASTSHTISAPYPWLVSPVGAVSAPPKSALWLAGRRSGVSVTARGFRVVANVRCAAADLHALVPHAERRRGLVVVEDQQALMGPPRRGPERAQDPTLVEGAARARILARERIAQAPRRHDRRRPLRRAGPAVPAD